ncbi:response regulator transcription factor [Paenibacillus alkalitolerans]|uniref:response regulator transcription factor n=1 Tax=Paenibacillus alkalitolerans TaxID=2799335 RepID=UPI001F43EDAA|nr:response regulator transcription factor [Paenibacillus alkalitolerans]
MEQRLERERIKVLLVEDDPDWLRGLKAYLDAQPDLRVAASASTPEDARRAAEEHDPDVVLMDIMLAESPAGIDLTAELTSALGAKVIMLTSLEDKETIFDAFRAGAIDYHIKSNFESIPDAVRAAHRNRAAISADAAEQMRAEFRRLKKLERDVQVKELRDRITPTELEVLKMIHDGHTQPEIANRFVVSLRTIKIHVGHIIKKLGAGSSKEAAKKAGDAGLFNDSGK